MLQRIYITSYRTKVTGVLTVVKMIPHNKVIVLIESEASAAVGFDLRQIVCFNLHKSAIQPYVLRTQRNLHSFIGKAVGPIIVDGPFIMFRMRTTGFADVVNSHIKPQAMPQHSASHQMPSSR